MENSLNYFILSKHSIHLVPAIIISLFIILLTWYCHKIIKRAIFHQAKLHKIEPKLIQAILTMTKIFIYSLASTLLLENLHIHVSALLGTLGVVAIGAGFALQNALANMTSGMFLLFYKPFFIGDEINIMDEYKREIEGTVTDINLRMTELKSNNEKILIPNHALLASIVIIKKHVNQSENKPIKLDDLI